MLFSSITFLYYFLPVVLFLYFAVPHSWKNSVLLLASLFFYGWGEPVYLFVMIAAILFAYGMGIQIEKYRESKMGQRIFAAAVGISLLYLGFFKYFNFFITNLNALFSWKLTGLQVTLPIGISFYTFQLLSYLVDVYRGSVPARKDPVSFALYIAMFPQLIAGPIVRYSVIDKELDKRGQSAFQIGEGIGIFVLGLSKKVLLANPLGELCEILKASSELSVLAVWIYAAAISLHIYFDFSGYSDMAIGLGRMFGFHFPENFRYPFTAKSISEFWRRWHISLGTWFRDYVYIPLGGNRVGTVRFMGNLFVVWFLTGFWHGAGWNFILWGLYFGLLLVMEKFFLKKFLDKSMIAGRIYVLVFVMISFVIFDGTNLSEAWFYIRSMFSLEGLPFVTKEILYELKNHGVLLLFAVFAATPVGKQIYSVWRQRAEKCRWFEWLETAAIFFLLILVTAYLIDGSYNPFLYFRF